MGKKALLATLAYSTFLFSQDLSIGIGPYFQTQPYKGAKPLYVPSPVVFYDNGIIYARWTRFGVYFYGHKANKEAGERYSWGFSLTAQPRPNGYKPSDSDALNGLDEKKTSFEGGLAFSVFGNGKYLEAMLVTDLLGRYDSYIAKVETGMQYKTGNWSFTPNLVLVYESQKFTRYYYGIDQDEASRTSYPLYQPSGGLRIAAQTYATYSFTDTFSAFFNLRIDRLTNNAAASPIVEEDYVYSGLASILYTFK